MFKEGPVSDDVPSPVLPSDPEPEVPKRTIIKMANGNEIDLNDIKVRKFSFRNLQDLARI